MCVDAEGGIVSVRKTSERRFQTLEQKNARLESALALALERIDALECAGAQRRIDALECAKNDKLDESDIEKEKRRKSESEASLALSLRLHEELNS